MSGRQVFFGLVLLFSFICFNVASVRADVKGSDKPERGLVAGLRYPGVTIGSQEKARIDFYVKNTGRWAETILFEIVEKPEGWDVRLKSYNDSVSGIFLAEDEDRTLTLTAGPEGRDEKIPPGEYRLTVRAATADGVLSRTSSVDLTVTAEEKSEEEVKLTTSYPVLKGPSDSKFEFSLDVSNDSEEDALFNLQAAAPEGWEVSFKPAYEEKQISSLQIKANQNRTVGVEVTPARLAEAGRYPVKVKVASARAKSEVDLEVVLTGTHVIKSGTLDGLLSLTTQPGREGHMSLYVRNEGSAPQPEVVFLSFKPENWKVEFKPEKLTDVKPGDLKQVEVSIISAEGALVGDYSVAVSVQGEKATDEVEFRVTVKASSTWGWIGVAIIILVLVGLSIIFKLLGRR